MSVVEFFSQPVWYRLSLTLVHFLWQGLAVAVIAAVAVRLLRLKRGNPRYAAYLAAFLLMTACPPTTFTLLGVPIEPVRSNTGQSAPKIESSEINRSPVSTTLLRPIAASNPTADPAHDVSLREWLNSTMRAALPWAPMCWMVGVFALSMRLFLGFVGVSRWRRGLEPLAEDIQARVALLSRRLGMPGFSRVFVSRRAMEAAAMGYFRPIVLLPAAFVTHMPPEMLEAVIAHELAHIRRFDLWVNLAQRVVETLLFYHPAVWWLSSHLRSERELCCDDLAIRTTGERLAYASALENARRIRFAAGQPSLALEFGQSKKTTLSRIRHILGLPPIPADSRAWLAGVIAVALLAILAIPTASALTAGAEKKPALDEPNQTPALRAPLSQFPYTLNGWTGEDLEIPTSIQQYMRDNFADDFINRRYINETSRQWAELYVVYSSSHPTGILRSDPRLCFPGNGWLWDQTTPSHIVTSSNRMLGCVMHWFHNPPAQQSSVVVVCFYIMDGRIVSEQELPLLLARETPQGLPRYVATIRITSNQENFARSAAAAMADALLDALGVREPLPSAVAKPVDTESGDTDGQSKQHGSPPITFNSQMAFDVFVKETKMDIPDPDHFAPDAQPAWIGRTPSTAALEIPAGWVWWVQPSLPVQDWNLLIQEVNRNRVPGLRLSQMATSDMAHLAKMPELQYLDLAVAHITDAGSAYLKNLTELQWLSLRGAEVSDTSMVNLEGMTKLEILDLSFTQITDAGIAHLQGLTGLRVLELENTQITDAGLSSLSNLSQLQWLDLTSDKITDAGLEQLKSLTWLKHVTIQGKQITAVGEQQFRRSLPNLTTDWTLR